MADRRVPAAEIDRPGCAGEKQVSIMATFNFSVLRDVRLQGQFPASDVFTVRDGSELALRWYPAHAICI
ncbi:hypothetical protein [Thiomonas sp. X19]|uniref:hypothetical protein n=1 Tax=Thiomonas sp. X19 TaxID=1050370 RepID=UPI0011BE2AFE|nr:hypothetical protein [Thiomonas sp. X19]